MNAAIDGLGILLDPHAKLALESLETISERTRISTVNGNPKCTVMSAHSPTNVTSEDTIQQYHSELTTLIHQVPKRIVLFLCGDMNIQVGLISRKHHYHKTNNRNDERLCELQHSTNLINLCTKFSKRPGKKLTFMYSNGTKAQMDHILITWKWENIATDSAAYNTFHSVSSNHNIVTIKCRLCLRGNKSRLYAPKFDWSKIMCNKDIKEKFSIEIINRFEALQSDNNTDNDPNAMYNNVIEANQYVASETIPIMTKRPSTEPWHSQSIEVKRSVVSQVIRISLENPSPENSEQIRKASEELDHQYKKEQEKYVKNKIAELNNAHTNKKTKVVWQIANEICNRNK